MKRESMTALVSSAARERGCSVPEARRALELEGLAAELQARGIPTDGLDLDAQLAIYLDVDSRVRGIQPATSRTRLVKTALNRR